MTIVRYSGEKLGKEYTGFDGDLMIKIKSGAELEVADKTADRLLQDFPESFEIISRTSDSPELGETQVQEEEPEAEKTEKKKRGRPKAG